MNIDTGRSAALKYIEKGEDGKHVNDQEVCPSESAIKHVLPLLYWEYCPNSSVSICVKPVAKIYANECLTSIK